MGGGADGGGRGGVVGIYHTHNAESYVPTSGTESKEDGQGDVLQVGKALAAALEKQGVEVHWTPSSHLPTTARLIFVRGGPPQSCCESNPDHLN